MSKKKMNQVVEVFMHKPDAVPPKNVRPPDEPDASAHPVELNELSSSPEASGSPLIQSVNPLHQVKATLQVCVGVATMTVGELLATKESQVIPLDRAVHQPVDLLLEGQVVARGQLVAVDDQFAIRITELPLPLHLGEPHKS